MAPWRPPLSPRFASPRLASPGLASSPATSRLDFSPSHLPDRPIPCSSFSADREPGLSLRYRGPWRAGVMEAMLQERYCRAPTDPPPHDRHTQLDSPRDDRREKERKRAAASFFFFALCDLAGVRRRMKMRRVARKKPKEAPIRKRNRHSESRATVLLVLSRSIGREIVSDDCEIPAEREGLAILTPSFKLIARTRHYR